MIGMRADERIILKGIYMKINKDIVFRMSAIVGAILYIITMRYVCLENYKFATIFALLLSSLFACGYLIERYAK